MKRIVFHFDLISPYAYLAFHRLPQVLEGCSYEVEYRPVLFAAMLKAHAHKGPAEIEPKRAWTFRHVHWLAHEHGIALDTPAVHPFNPLPLMRLVLACGPNRRVVEAAFAHVWQGGHDPADPQRLAALSAVLAPVHDPQSDVIKAALRAHTEQAIAEGVFGVPTFSVDGRAIWGLDALPMLHCALRDEPWFAGSAWDDAGRARTGVVRR